MRVAIVHNTAVTHAGQVGRALTEAGARSDICRAYAGETLPALKDYDALVVLGGEQNARDDLTHPYLPELARLMRCFGDAGKAVLGICLGSQLLARAYDGENQIGMASEFGWRTITRTDAGYADPVISAVPEEFVSFQWHDDTFSLPPGAVHLAENQVARHQAFRLGRAAYGFQFHFEADCAVVRSWIDHFGDVIDKKAPGWLDGHPQQESREGRLSDEAGLAIARAWVAQIEPKADKHGA